jgi:L-iditol 2-dehydrogenase
MNTKMKAALFKGPENIIIETVKKPYANNNSIIVKVGACGICGSDIRNYHKGLRHGISSQVMGHEIGGIVHEAGKDVKDFKKGDKVAIAPDVSCGKCYYCQRGFVNLCIDHKMIGTHWPGGFAEYLEIPDVVLRRGMVHKMPDGLSFEEATLAEPLSSVITSQKEAPVELGDTVLILGDGPIGCLHLEIARARGASRIIIVGLNKLKLAKRFEPDLLIDAGKSDPVKEVLNFTNGLGADIAICANPVSTTQEQAIESVRKRGKVILFGGLPEDNPYTNLNSNIIHYNELSITGAFSYPAHMHKFALETIKNKKITSYKYIDLILPIDEITRGFKEAEKGNVLKVIIKP